MQADKVKPCTHRRHVPDVEGVLIPVAVGCAVLAAYCHLLTLAWWAALTATTLAWLATIAFSSTHPHGRGRFDDFLYGQSTSVACTPLVAIIVFWHYPHASRWGVLVATLGAGALAAIGYFMAARMRRRDNRAG
ncbi:MAG TPA: hypothetical protein VF292_13595 [Rhodanobacteraceae bacterium]